MATTNYAQYLNQFSLDVTPVSATDVISELIQGTTSWGQLAYELFQNSGEFVNLDRFSNVVDLLIAEPWNNIPSPQTFIDLATDFYPEIDRYASAIINGIDIYENVQNGVESVDEAIDTVKSIVNWADTFRNNPSNEI
ncbi:MAG: hypothetical protein ACRDBG_26075 [Waterburya sp.]